MIITLLCSHDKRTTIYGSFIIHRLKTTRCLTILVIFIVLNKHKNYIEYLKSVYTYTVECCKVLVVRHTTRNLLARITAEGHVHNFNDSIPNRCLKEINSARQGSILGIRCSFYELIYVKNLFANSLTVVSYLSKFTDKFMDGFRCKDFFRYFFISGGS